ncbi:MAG: hypothetical protein AB7O38_24230, partial [Pirellulaceae bacterium]
WSVWLAGGLLIASIQLLYYYAYRTAPVELRPSLVALDVEGRGSLASWFATVVLGVAAFGSLMVYRIRRHRTNDYNGRYRWWLWLVPLLLILSVNAATGLHHALSGILTRVTGAEIALQGKGWWMLAYAAVFFPILAQMVIELWPSRLASWFLLVTTACYVASGLFELGAWRLEDESASALCYSAVLLSAHLGVLLTVLAYGRYVYLDAHERLTARRRWVKWPSWKRSARRPSAPKAKKPAKTRAAKQVRVDDAHTQFGQPQSATAAATITAPALEEAEEGSPSDVDEDEGSDRKLSRAERRRLRKETQRTQR